jgi:outer membrane receptor protein involved in Fe transport
MGYVQGWNDQLHAYLPSIPPLNTVVGVRFHDPEKVRNWSLEVAARIVNDQNQVGVIPDVGGTPTIYEEATPGFTVWHLAGYYNYSKNLTFTGGIENLFNINYQEHLDLRVAGPAGFSPYESRVLQPGITPYAGVRWTF